MGHKYQLFLQSIASRLESPRRLINQLHQGSKTEKQICVDRFHVRSSLESHSQSHNLLLILPLYHYCHSNNFAIFMIYSSASGQISILVPTGKSRYLLLICGIIEEGVSFGAIVKWNSVSNESSVSNLLAPWHWSTLPIWVECC